MLKRCLILLFFVPTLSPLCAGDNSWKHELQILTTYLESGNQNLLKLYVERNPTRPCQPLTLHNLHTYVTKKLAIENALLVLCERIRRFYVRNPISSQKIPYPYPGLEKEEVKIYLEQIKIHQNYQNLILETLDSMLKYYKQISGLIFLYTYLTYYYQKNKQINMDVIDEIRSTYCIERYGEQFIFLEEQHLYEHIIPFAKTRSREDFIFTIKNNLINNFQPKKDPTASPLQEPYNATQKLNFFASLQYFSLISNYCSPLLSNLLTYEYHIFSVTILNLIFCVLSKAFTELKKTSRV